MESTKGKDAVFPTMLSGPVSVAWNVDASVSPALRSILSYVETNAIRG